MHLPQSATVTRFWTCYKPICPSKAPYWRCPAGTGQHAAFFAPRLAPRYWLPTDVDEISLSSIEAWRETRRRRIFWHPGLDVLDTRWLVEDTELPEPLSAMVNINMVHIAPWPCCEGLFDGAERILPHGRCADVRAV
ncbi:MAG: hypothetical protein CM15mP74_15960 [Halieaceae bacterium]|nr:MAG: hypothetical protein CM15mP74_15960 [Halieaceae bacterium]